MSYILDALRKADAQRERDPARGIHAQPAQLAAGSGSPAGGYRTWLWAASAVGVAALASAVWYLYQDRGAVAPPSPVQMAVAPRAIVPDPAQPAVAPMPIGQPAPPVAAAVLPPPPPALNPFQVGAAQQAPPLPGSNPFRPEGDPKNTSQPTLRGGPPPASNPFTAAVTGAVPASNPFTGAKPSTAQAPPLATAPATTTAPATARAMSPTPVPAPVTAAPMAAPAPSVPNPPVAGLPADAPKLSISGGVYSSNRAQRMLIVNGQVFNEGGDLGSGVVLEEIKPKSAVLRFRGGRFTVTY